LRGIDREREKWKRERLERKMQKSNGYVERQRKGRTIENIDGQTKREREESERQR